MSATNHTNNYQLSQFIGTDKPAWLVDYNGDMLKIDNGIKGAVNDAAVANALAGSADGKADANALNIATLNGQINDPATGLAAAVGTLNTAVSSLGSQIGNTPLPSGMSSVTDAIDEVAKRGYQLKEFHYDENIASIASATTLGTFCTTIINAINAIRQALPDGDAIEVTSFFLGDFCVLPIRRLYTNNDDFGSAHSFVIIPRAADTKIKSIFITRTTSNQFWNEVHVANDGSITTEHYATGDAIPNQGNLYLSYNIWTKSV